MLSAGMIACHGKVQREGEVIHVITDQLEDLSDLLRSVGERDAAIPDGHEVRDIDVPASRVSSGIKVRIRTFR